MKLSTALLYVASMASTVTASRTISGKNVAKVLRSARRLDQNEENGEEDYAFLQNFSLKLISCKAGERVQNAEDGEYEYNAAVFRLCPTEDGCDNESVRGCSAGYGDYLVGLDTFVDAYFEDQRDNMEWDDNFEVDRYTQCEEYEVEQGDDAQEEGDDAVQYYIGPTCTEEGDDIRLGLFEDETCVTESATSFATISNGWTLPFGTGGLVSDNCMSCSEYDEDEGAYDIREMCTNLYEAAPAKCEAKMETYSYYGQNIQGCDYITEMLPVLSSRKGGRVFGWILFFALIIGMAGYIVWWRKKKASTQTETGVVA